MLMAVSDLKKCRQCKESKQLTEFYIDKRYNSRVTLCRSCWVKSTSKWAKENPERMAESTLRYCLKNREKILERGRKRYAKIPKEERKRRNRKENLKRLGLDEESLAQIFIKQNGVCAICAEQISLRNDRFTHLDHCHKSKKFRGILCTKCNTGLGKFNENVAVLQNAILYLEKNKV